MFIPIKDDAPIHRKPYVTISLIAANTLIFLFSFVQGAKGFQLITYQFGYIPYELIHSVELTPQLPAPVYLTAFTSMFMHGGWMHLIGNMLFLWIYGNNIEDYFGPIKFILFYIIAGLAAIALYTLFGPNTEVPLVGASGAIAGVMGAYMVLHPESANHGPRDILLHTIHGPARQSRSRNLVRLSAPYVGHGQLHRRRSGLDGPRWRFRFRVSPFEIIRQTSRWCSSFAGSARI